MPVINSWSLSSKSILLSLALGFWSWDWKHFSADTMLPVSRRCWRDTAEGRAFSPCFCCGFLSLFFFPTRGYPVEHTFPCWAQDWPQSSDHLTAVCPMQKPLTTDFQHFMHQYPSACTLGEYFCPGHRTRLGCPLLHMVIPSQDPSVSSQSL